METKNRCRKCGGENEAAGKYCLNCGESLLIASVSQPSSETGGLKVFSIIFLVAGGMYLACYLFLSLINSHAKSEFLYGVRGFSLISFILLTAYGVFFLVLIARMKSRA